MVGVCITRNDNLRVVDQSDQDENRPFLYGLNHSVRLSRLGCRVNRTVDELITATTNWRKQPPGHNDVLPHPRASRSGPEFQGGGMGVGQGWVARVVVSQHGHAAVEELLCVQAPRCSRSVAGQQGAVEGTPMGEQKNRHKALDLQGLPGGGFSHLLSLLPPWPVAQALVLAPVDARGSEAAPLDSAALQRGADLQLHPGRCRPPWPV